MQRILFCDNPCVELSAQQLRLACLSASFKRLQKNFASDKLFHAFVRASVIIY